MLRFLRDLVGLMAGLATIAAFGLTVLPKLQPGLLPRLQAEAPQPDAIPQPSAWNPFQALSQPPELGADNLGIRFKPDQGSHYPKIREVRAGSPAHQAGLQVGDTLLSIDNEPTVALNAQEIRDRLKGDAGTQVSLRVAREGEGSREILVIR